VGDVGESFIAAEGPLFSVLVANYQNAAYLDDALNSLVDQTYQSWEAVVVDDSSTDESAEVLARWKSDQRVIPLFHQSRRGPGAAFRTAACAARGDLMGMLGADDALRPDAVMKMVDAHRRNPLAALINSNLVVCDEKLRPTGEPSPYRALPEGETLIRACSVSSFATFKRSAYLRTAGFDETLMRAVDHDIYLKLEEVGSLAYVDSALYLYRANPHGVSQGANGMLAAQCAIIARANAYRRRRISGFSNLSSSEYRSMMSVYHRREVSLGRTFSTSEALSHLTRAVAYRPRSAVNASFWRCVLHAVAGKRLSS
jgi:glycosyltransferase involved in cell wall biosynthesis